MANTGRMNLAEELGRIDSEKMNRNRSAEKNRVIHELNAGYKKGGRVKVNEGGYIGPSIRGEYGGVNLSNPHNKKYYKGMV